jgi:hypothetical protein
LSLGRKGSRAIQRHFDTLQEVHTGDPASFTIFSSWFPSSTMPAVVLQTPTPEELDDLIYFARTSDLPALKTAILQVCERHSSLPSTILATAIDIDEDGLGSQSCLLHWPSANGNLEVVKYLLSLLLPSETNGTNAVSADKNAPSLVNHRNISGNTPLHWAALNGHLACVKALAAAGADASIINEAGHDAVYEAECSGKDGGKEVADWILANCAGLEKGTNAHATEGEADIGDGLVAENTDPNQKEET